MNRQLSSSGTPWESTVGYSRAVRTGNIIEVSGTTAMDGDLVIGDRDVAQQTRFILKRIETSLKELGASLHDVVRTRMYVIDIENWETIGSVHGEIFGDIRPAATMVEVSKLIRPELLIEIEATAIIDR